MSGSMTPVERVREAARLMLERAEAATSGPWVVAEDDGRLVVEPAPTPPVPRWRPVAIMTSDEDDPESWVDDRPDAAHIASWHPGAVRPVAKWLDETAQMYESLGGLWPISHALAVADAYLGEQS